ncbi:MAG: preprotein translocase subunit SecG [Clostridia bacterium]|nr:preprotein translocase subunit SecG [Clostridia bacterium]
MNSILMNTMLLMADDAVSPIYPIIRIILIILIVMCALFMIFVVLLQPGNSSGIGAIGGGAETFLGKNKAKTLEGKMKRLTVIVAILFAVFLIAFAIISIVGL